MIEALIRRGTQIAHLRIDPTSGAALEGTVAALVGRLPDVHPGRAPDVGKLDIPYPVVMAWATPQSRAALSVAGWNEIPEALACFEGGVGSELLVTMAAGPYFWVQHWISGDAGWFAIAADREGLTLTPNTPDDIARALTANLLALVTCGGTDV